MMKPIHDIRGHEALAALFGVMGALLLALKIEVSGLGFLLFTLSSVLWTMIAYKMYNMPLMWMNVVFTACNILGVYRWLM